MHTCYSDTFGNQKDSLRRKWKTNNHLSHGRKNSPSFWETKWPFPSCKYDFDSFFSENGTSVAKIIIATHCESIVISVKNVAAPVVSLLSVTYKRGGLDNNGF